MKKNKKKSKISSLISRMKKEVILDYRNNTATPIYVLGDHKRM